MYKNEAFHIGESFHKISKEIIPDNFFEDSDDDYHWFIPSVVNMSFACELYLKSLLSDGNKGNLGHDIKELFDDLSNEKKEIIKNSLEFRGDKEFEKNIKINKDVFKNWRYAFEKKEKTVDIIFLENFANVLHDIAEKECYIFEWNNKITN